MSRPKKKIIETTGKIEEPVVAGKPAPHTFTRLEQVWGGFNEMSRYGTLSAEEYDAQLNDMNRTDMEAHARKLGVVILESTGRLKASLQREFGVYVSTLHRPQASTSSVAAKNTPLSNEVKKILAEGR